MSGLVGGILELWNINSSTYPSIDFKFNFDSGPDQLSTPVLYGFSIGTRVGTGFNQTYNAPDSPQNGFGQPKVWVRFDYIPVVLDHTFSPAKLRPHFSYPIASITPYVEDDCAESPEIGVIMNGNLAILSSNTTYTLGESAGLPNGSFGFVSYLTYQNPCNVGGIWFDLEFAHHSKQIRIDVANDGDVDYEFTEPAFDMFGRQTKFITSKDANNVHYGTEMRTLTLGLSGSVEGGEFMLPVGATITAAEIGFENNQISSTTDINEGFEWKLMSGLEEFDLGLVGNLSDASQESYPEDMNFTSALNTLMQSSLTPVAHIDANGNGWKKFRFSIESLNATTGSTIDLVGLDVVYDVTHFISMAIISHGNCTRCCIVSCNQRFCECANRRSCRKRRWSLVLKPLGLNDSWLYHNSFASQQCSWLVPER